MIKMIVSNRCACFALHTFDFLPSVTHSMSLFNFCTLRALMRSIPRSPNVYPPILILTTKCRRPIILVVHSVHLHKSLLQNLWTEEVNTVTFFVMLGFFLWHGGLWFVFGFWFGTSDLFCCVERFQVVRSILQHLCLNSAKWVKRWNDSEKVKHRNKLEKYMYPERERVLPCIFSALMPA